VGRTAQHAKPLVAGGKDSMYAEEGWAADGRKELSQGIILARLGKRREIQMDQRDAKKGDSLPRASYGRETEKREGGD